MRCQFSNAPWLMWILTFPLLLIGCSEDPPSVSPEVPSPPGLELSDFSSASECQSCHPQYFEEWDASMHHYASNDPIWMLANNGLQGSTQGRLADWCWQCHSPIGFLTGNTPDIFQFADLPDLVKEGVNCDVCHILRPPHTTTDQNIGYTLEPGPTKYALLQDPVPAMAHENGFDASFRRSEVCQECHDLIINSVPVEMTFTEWATSPYGAMGLECQDCHMPVYSGTAAFGGPVRENLHRHDFVGVDVAVTDFPGKAAQLAAVDVLLKKSASISVIAPTAAGLNDPVGVSVLVSNDRTGHNLPSSVFFNRQMWIEVTVWNGSDTVYRSGHLDANGDLMDRNSALRPNEDTDLTLFSGVLYKNGEETNVFELDSLVNNSLPPFAVHNAQYGFVIDRAGSWNLRVRLLFRPFGPYLFRGLGLDQYIAALPTFEMYTYASMIEVQ